MTDVTLMQDLTQHFCYGVGVSGLSYATSWRKSFRDDRKERKREALSAMELILNSQPIKNVTPAADGATPAPIAAQSEGVPQDSLQYAQNVMTVRDYLVSEGSVAFQRTLGERAKDLVTNMKEYFVGNRINRLGHGARFVPSTVLEAIDTAASTLYYQHTLGVPFIGAVALNAYEIPVFWAGLTVGKYALKPVDAILRSGEEKKLDKTLSAMCRQTGIVDIVTSYEPPVDVHRKLELAGVKMYGAKLTAAGKGLVAGARQIVGDVLHHGERVEARRIAESQKLKDDFDALTKGR